MSLRLCIDDFVDCVKLVFHFPKEFSGNSVSYEPSN
jgi:hypothetical protein